MAGSVIGFLLESEDLERGPVCVTGDTLWAGRIRSVVERHRPGTIVIVPRSGRFAVSDATPSGPGGLVVR